MRLHLVPKYDGAAISVAHEQVRRRGVKRVEDKVACHVASPNLDKSGIIKNYFKGM